MKFITSGNFSTAKFTAQRAWKRTVIDIWSGLSLAIAIFFLSTTCSAVSVQPYAFGVGAFAVGQGPLAIAAADFNGDRRIDLAVADDSGVSVLLGKPDGSFAAKVDYPTAGAGATALMAGDVNGDGKVDLIVLAGQVELLMGNGDGTFQTATNLSLPPSFSGITAVTSGDFNKDGKLDLAITGSEGGGPVVAILLGHGNGTFGTPTAFPTGGSFSVIAGDFDGDGNTDLVVGNGYVGGGGDTISVLLGKGNGSFKPYLSVPVPGDGDDLLGAADFNHDGKLDLAVASFYNSPGGISVLLGNGDATFAPAVSYPAPALAAFTNAIALGDFDGDGYADIVVTNSDTDDISVFIGVGDGTFKNALEYPASINPVGIVTGDFNGDGRQDIAAVAGYILSAEVTILIGKGDGTFSNHVNHAIPIYPYDIAAGDFNGDGKADLVVDSLNTPGAVTILLGNGQGGFANHKDSDVGNHPSFLTTGDFNGDGKLDVIVSASQRGNGTEVLSTLLGNGDGTLQAPLNQQLASVPSNFVVADFDMDGKLDLATCMQLTTGVSVFKGKGDGTFSTPVFFDAGNTGTNAGPIFSADVNGDHKPDLVVATSNGVSILLGNGNGSFQAYRATLPGYSLLGVGDFNEDGKQDLVVYSGSPFIGIARGNGDGTFNAPQSVFVTSLLSADRSVVGDFNGDGRLDFAFISSSIQMLSILPGKGDGTFGERIDLPTENSPWSLTAADLTGSGGLDFAIGAARFGTTSTVSVYRNRPVGALYPSSFQFGIQTIGTTSKARSTKLYNSGGLPMAIAAITTTGPFAATHNCGIRLAVGSSCTISITFTPTTAGRSAGTLLVRDSAMVKPQAISFSGTGVK